LIGDSIGRIGVVADTLCAVVAVMSPDVVYE
jgi:hypothetical protein